MNRKCEKISEEIWESAHTGRAFTPETVNHISRCPNCARTAADAERLLACLRTASAEPSRTDCREAVRSYISASSTRKPVRLRYAVASFALLALFMVSLLYSHRSGPKSMLTRPAQPTVVAQLTQPTCDTVPTLTDHHHAARTHPSAKRTGAKRRSGQRSQSCLIHRRRPRTHGKPVAKIVVELPRITGMPDRTCAGDEIRRPPKTDEEKRSHDRNSSQTVSSFEGTPVGMQSAIFLCSECGLRTASVYQDSSAKAPPMLVQISHGGD
jgi:hypothetical protein